MSNLLNQEAEKLVQLLNKTYRDVFGIELNYLDA